MTLGEFRGIIENVPDYLVFSIGISEPFAWRGIYAEVAFSFINKPMTKKEVLQKIETALTDTFTGYKGGDFEYNEDTEIHFEESVARYSDGDYLVKTIIKLITNKKV